MTKLLKVLLIILIGSIVVLVLVMLSDQGQIAAQLSNARGDQEPRKIGRKSIVYQVFKPAISLSQNIGIWSGVVGEYFRPSNLKLVGCDFLPARPERIPIKWIVEWATNCP